MLEVMSPSRYRNDLAIDQSSGGWQSGLVGKDWFVDAIDRRPCPLSYKLRGVNSAGKCFFERLLGNKTGRVAAGGVFLLIGGVSRQDISNP